jgi:hypothetical protein
MDAQAFAKSYAKDILYQKAFWKVNNIGKEWQGSLQKISTSMPESILFYGGR